MATAGPAPDPTRPVVPRWGALVVAVAAGPVLDGAFPHRGGGPRALVGGEASQAGLDDAARRTSR